MKRLCQLALAAAVLACLTGRTPGDDPAPAPAAEVRDPERVFRLACGQLLALERKHHLLKGVSEVKPALERDEKERLKSASLIFERNALPPGKGPAEPKDESKPFLYVSIQVWSGRTQQPPADLHEFEWKGQTYQMWVRVFGTDAELVKAIRRAVDVKQHELPQLTFRLQTSQSLRAYRKGQPLIFEGEAADPIHRPGPEHFKLTRVTDTRAVPLRVDYNREKVERRSPQQRQAATPVQEVYGCNSLFRGVRVFLYDGTFSMKHPEGKAGILGLYGCPTLEAGVLYRLTWACWPVGAREAVEVSCEFKLDR
jgi:hypothetical protein